MPNELATRMKEIDVLVNNVNTLRRELAAKGITEIDDEDRMEAIDIINRIERRMLAKMSDQPAQEAAE